jgi:cell division protein FtsX
MPYNPLPMSMPIAIQEPSPDPEPVRAKLRKMSDSELVRYGRECKAKINPDKRVTELDLMTLRECRLEWLRRREARRKR